MRPATSYRHMPVYINGPMAIKSLGVGGSSLLTGIISLTEGGVLGRCKKVRFVRRVPIAGSIRKLCREHQGHVRLVYFIVVMQNATYINIIIFLWGDDSALSVGMVVNVFGCIEQDLRQASATGTL